MTIIPASIKKSRRAVVRSLKASETVEAGQLVYKATSSTVGVADASVSGRSTVCGIALNSATVGNPVVYAESDPLLEIGGSHKTGEVYVAGEDGEIIRSADTVVGHKTATVGVVVSRTKIALSIHASAATAISGTPPAPTDFITNGVGGMTFSWSNPEPFDYSEIEIQVHGGDWSMLEHTVSNLEGQSYDTVLGAYYPSSGDYDARIRSVISYGGAEYRSSWVEADVTVITG